MDDLEEMRMRFWMDVYVTAIRIESNNPKAIADEALNEFNKKFFGSTMSTNDLLTASETM